MREIKFRAWDFNKRQMFTGIKVNWISRAVWFANTDYVGNLIFDKKENKFGCILLQYTGLLDTNGVEIYEGDIIRAFDKNYEVKFIQTESGLRVDYGYPDKHNAPAPHWCKIIGNIYENPDELGDI